MTIKVGNPGVQAGVSCVSAHQNNAQAKPTSRGQQEQRLNAGGFDTSRAVKRNKRHAFHFQTVRDASLTLLASRPELPRREAGLCGHLCVSPQPSARQLKVLSRLLDAYKLPPMSRDVIT